MGKSVCAKCISATPPARKAVAIAYVRDGKLGTATPSSLGTSPILPSEAAPAPIKPAVPSAVKLGLNVRDLTARDRELLSLPPTTTGVFIVSVDPGTPAERVGFPLNGAVLQKLGRKTITSKADYAQSASTLAAGAGTTLVLLTSDAGQIHQTAVTLRL